MKINQGELDESNTEQMREHFKSWAKVLGLAKPQFVETNVQKVNIMDASNEMNVKSKAYLEG